MRKSRPLKIGITGGIGSGKSFVASILINKGYPVYNADWAAKNLLNSDPILRAKVIDLFGQKAYQTKDGTLNRPYIASVVFSDPDKLNALNALVHPAVKVDFEAFVQNHSQSELVFKEAAIIFEANTQDQLDGVILVTAPEPIRIARVQARDNMTLEDIRKRINQQWPDEIKRLRANFVVENDGTTPIEPQLDAILQTLAQW